MARPHDQLAVHADGHKHSGLGAGRAGHEGPQALVSRAVRALAHARAQALHSFLQHRAAHFVTHIDRQFGLSRQQHTLAVLDPQGRAHRQLDAIDQTGHLGEVEGGKHHACHLVCRVDHRQAIGQDGLVRQPAHRIGANHKPALLDGVLKVGAVTQIGFFAAAQRMTTCLAIEPGNAQVGVFRKPP